MKNIIRIKTSDLTDEQKMIYNADIELGKNISIKGGPGTGKTTLLFLIAQKIKNLGYNEFRIITLQNNLKNFLKDSFGDLDKHIKNAWGSNSDNKEMEGVMYLLARKYNSPFPGNFFKKPNKEKDEILENLLQKVKNDNQLKESYKKYIILIDESQDLPLLYFKILKELFNTIYIFGDNNQQINNWGSNINDIENLLDILVRNTYFDINFRNAKQIYNFAKLTGFKENEIELPVNGSKVDIFTGDYDKKIEIKKIISDNIGKNIAIITNYSNQNNYGGINGIQLVNSSQNYIRYDTYDNFCLNWKNNKGLEFDIVILVDFDKKQFFTKDMYVSITRAKDKIYILDNKITGYLNIENNYNFNIIIKSNLEKEINVEDIPF